VSDTTNQSLGQRLKRGVESKILVPVATTIVSAAASYLIKKLPLILEEKVLPKLREKDAPEPVVHALEQTATTLGGDSSPNGDEPGSEQQASESAMSNEEREEQRREREKRRRERKRAAAKAA
jgi:hypothetical protein